MYILLHEIIFIILAVACCCIAVVGMINNANGYIWGGLIASSLWLVLLGASVGIRAIRIHMGWT